MTFDNFGHGSYHPADSWLDALHDLTLEADLIVRFPPDVPLYVCELMATLGVSVEADATMPPYRDLRTRLDRPRPSR